MSDNIAWPLSWPVYWPVWKQPTRYGRVLVVTPPSVEPVSLAEIKAHVRQEDVTIDDTILSALIPAAREMVEHATEHALVQRTLRYTFDDFNWGRIELGWSPFRELVDVRYLDADGAERIVDSAIYAVDASSDRLPARLLLKPNQSWPTTQARRASCWATYKVGYSDSGSPSDFGVALSPAPLKAAIKLIVGDLYEHREANLEGQTYENRAVAALLAPYAKPTL